jgi:hypothetical protein
MHRHLVVNAHINDELQQAVAGLAAIEDQCGAALVLHASLASKHLAAVAPPVQPWARGRGCFILGWW